MPWELRNLTESWTYAEGILGDAYPDWTAAHRWVVSAAMAVAFFTSLLIHELSHSIVARHYGLPVSSITLFVFGGVSNLEREPDSAQQEFRVAVIGPLTSLVLAALFALAFIAVSTIDTATSRVLLNLALINLGLAIFNLTPGFPLDGGRLVRSYLWSRKRNRLEATRVASFIGQGMAFAMMAFGVGVALTGEVLTGIWLLIIGNFLRGAALSSYGQLLTETAVQGVGAATIARKDFTAVLPSLPLVSLERIRVREEARQTVHPLVPRPPESLVAVPLL